MKLPDFLIKWNLNQKKINVDFATIIELCVLCTIISAIITLALTFYFANHNQFILTLVVLSLSTVSAMIGLYLCITYPSITIYNIHITKLFSNENLPEVDIRSIVQQTLSKDDYETLMSSKVLIAKFRVGLYNILRKYISQYPENCIIPEEDVILIIRMYTKKFKETHIESYKRVVQCYKRKAFQTIEKEICQPKQQT